MRRGHRSTAGYTLLELIIVIAVFAVLAAMAYGGLSYVLKSRREVEQRMTRISEYQKAYQRLRDDFLDASSRLIRDSDGAPQPAFLYDSYLHRPEFTRGGWANPAGLPRATLERVSYFLDDSDADDRKLVRRSWRVLDRAPQSPSVDLTLLHGVDKLKWRFLDINLQWHDDWSQQGTTTGATTTTTTTTATAAAAGVNAETALVAMMPVPLAVELTAQTRDWGELRFLFRLGAEGYSQAPALAAAATTGSTGATGTGTGTGTSSGNGTTGGSVQQ